MQKKLVYIIPCLGIGGAEVALLSAIPFLYRNYQLSIVCLKAPDPRFISKLSAEERSSIRVFRGALGLKYIRSIIYILLRRPDILVSSLWRGSALGSFSKILSPRIEFVEFIHSSQFFNFADRLFTKLALKCCDAVFCDSNASKHFVQPWVHKKSTEVISFLRFESPSVWKAKQQLTLKAIFIGRFHSAKRIDRIIDLVKALREKNVLFHVDLYGKDHGTMPSVKALVAENHLENAVSFCGECESSQVQNLLSKYDFYFQTSQVEGMAMSTVEAMQQGLVCVLTPAGEIPNYAIDGKNALLFNEDFEKDLPRIVQQLCDMCRNLELYNAISEQAYLHFASAPSYSKSLCAALSRL